MSFTNFPLTVSSSLNNYAVRLSLLFSIVEPSDETVMFLNAPNTIAAASASKAALN